MQLRDAHGTAVAIGAELGRGGEGAVYDVQGRPDSVAKVYLKPPGADLAAKLSAMAASGSSGMVKLAAWPTSILHQRDGATVGFLMPKVAGFRPAFELYGPKLRLQQFPRADWRFLLRAASNTARAFGAVHATGNVIGDVNHGNLVIGQDATVRLIDCDSFQVTSGSRTWFCEVGVPTHQPPEMQGLVSYAGFPRTPNHDAFGLAVLVFQMLCLGRHPYSGRFTGKGDPPSIEEAIKGFRYAYGGSSNTTQMAVPPGSLAMDALTQPVRQLFERAFLSGGVAPHGRPNAAEWTTALDDMATRLVQCPISASHHHLASLGACPWCEIEARSNTLFFPAVFVPGVTGADGFLILWHQVTAVSIPAPREPVPVPPVALPTTDARRVGRRLRQVYLAAVLSLVTGWTAATQLPVAGFVASALQNGMEVFSIFLAMMVSATYLFLGYGIRKRVRSTRKSWNAVVRDWGTIPLEGDPARLRNGLNEIKASYDAVMSERARKMQALSDNRRVTQMRDHLDRHQIAKAKVRGVGPAKAAMLQSYGIETAADVGQRAIEQVPGFGPVTAQALLTWRQTVEASFRFDASRPVAAADIAQVENAAAASKRPLEQRLKSGLADLRASVAAEGALRDGLHRRVSDLLPAYSQALADSRASTIRF